VEHEESLEQFLERSRRRAGYGFALFCLLLLLIQMAVFSGLLPVAFEAASRSVLFLIALATFLLGLLELIDARVGAPAADSNSERPVWRLAGMAVLEGLLPTTGILLFGLALGWDAALGSPPILGYLLVLMIGILRLTDWALVVTGLTEIVSLGLLLIMVNLTAGPDGAAAASVLHVGKLALLAIGTVIAALIARQMRRFVSEMIHSHELELERERELFQKDRLISILAHDLRAPLNGITGLAEFMSNRPDAFDSSETRRYAREIHQSATQLRGLVDNLLEWARLRTGSLEPRWEAVSLEEVIQPILRLSQPALDARQLELERLGTFDVVVRTDLTLAQTVVRNVLSNAIKFSPTSSRITVKASAAEESVDLVIEDQGSGIPRHVLSGEQDHERQRSGLGLILCRELAGVLEIDLAFTSSESGGTRVRICFPLATTDETHD